MIITGVFHLYINDNRYYYIKTKRLYQYLYIVRSQYTNITSDHVIYSGKKETIAYYFFLNDYF